MAQATGGFPWQSQAQETDPTISEKPAGRARNVSGGESQPTEITIQQPSRVPTERQKHNSKSRKRAISVKASAPVIPQTREELDLHLSYNPSRQFNVRTIPPWVRDAEEDDIVDDFNDDDIIDSPHAALVAQHNSNPSNPMRTSRQDRTGRQDRFITSSGATRPDRTSRWITFARASAYPRENFHGEKVDTAWLNENFTDYSRPWLEGRGDDPESEGGRYQAFKRKRKGLYTRLRFTILRNPFVPLVFRFIVIFFAAIAIGLGAAIFHESAIIQQCASQPILTRDANCQNVLGNQEVDYYRDPSGLMAVIVDVIAIVYTVYITYDEYFSKPLGLRPARAKVRLVLLDLFFIVFQSANLSLAFEALTVDEGACYVGAEQATSFRFDRICDRAKALSSVLLVSLVAWLLTFSVSVLRLVERINTR